MAILESDETSHADARPTGRNGRAWFARLFGPKKKEPAAIPRGSRVYAVGDIHGRLDLLQKLWAQIEADASGSNLHKMIVFIGDYVDRGPDSKGVVDFLLQAKIKGGVTLCLRGNHDQAVLDFIADSKFYRDWRPFGAPETLLSYGVMPPQFDDETDFERARTELAQKCPEKHVNFLNSLPYSHSIGGYFFAHAGVRPGTPLEEQDPKDLLWIRDEFMDSRRLLEKVIVHGHTPLAAPTRRSNRISIDTGAYATGNLTAVVLEGTECRFLSTQIEREPAEGPIRGLETRFALAPNLPVR
jgi:serine/threonine protein phosphatase 1